MRVKITFLRAKDSNASVPLHHQKLVSSFVEFLITEIGQRPAFYNFSSLKGTSKVQNGFVRFMSSKVSLVFSSNDDAFVKAFMEKLMDKKMVHIGKLMLTPKAYQVVDAPVFATQMKYVCISPVVLVDPQLDSQGAMEIADPTSHDFSDLLYNAVADHMEKSGYTDEQLNAYAEFGAVPDAHYMHKVNTEGKKFARQYKSNEDLNMNGYLLPFTLHAHPAVHQFIWDCGLGVLNTEGYGMVDLAKEDRIEE